jgi:hypothetical protein
VVLDVYWYKIIHSLDLVSLVMVTAIDVIAAIIFIWVLWNRHRTSTQSLSQERQLEAGEVTTNAHENVETEQFIQRSDRNSMADDGGRMRAQDGYGRPRENRWHTEIDQIGQSTPRAGESNQIGNEARHRSILLPDRPPPRRASPATSPYQNWFPLATPVTMPTGGNDIHPALRQQPQRLVNVVHRPPIVPQVRVHQSHFSMSSDDLEPEHKETQPSAI